MAAFAARGLTVRYGERAALEALDLDVASGEIFVLLGGSGSGKTTLLRCIGGFLAPSAGSLTLDGRDITALPPHRRPVNTMFQSYALFPHLSVGDNVAFGLRALSGPQRRARAGEMLDLVRLPGLSRRRVGELSGGQQQRVALARSLAPRPRLLLLDEPFSALDRALREATRAEFIALLRQLGTTAILVTHDQDEALATADRIGILQSGRLAQIGTPAELYERPATRYIAAFLGAANVIEATVRTAGQGVAHLDLPGGAAILRIERAPGERLAFAVRPERMRMTTQSDGPNHLRGTVQSTTYRGSVLDICLRVPDGSVVRVAQPLIDGLADLPVPGQDAAITWASDAAVPLDA